MEDEKEFRCVICKKNYKTYQSLWKHKYIYHKPIGDHLVPILDNVQNLGDQNLIPESTLNKCGVCDKILANRHSRWRHEKKCKKDNEINLLKINEENIKIKNQLIEHQMIKETEHIKMKALEDKVNKLEKLITAKNSNTKTVNNNNNNGTIINNNIHINELGRENILNKLTLQEQINIATCHLFNESPHVEMVRLTYTKENCLENQNTLITNLQNKSCKVYNHKSKKFEATNKSQHIDNIIHYIFNFICTRWTIKRTIQTKKRYIKALISDIMTPTQLIS
jgi:phage FluMu protein Com